MGAAQGTIPQPELLQPEPPREVAEAHQQKRPRRTGEAAVTSLLPPTSRGGERARKLEVCQYAIAIRGSGVNSPPAAGALAAGGTTAAAEVAGGGVPTRVGVRRELGMSTITTPIPPLGCCWAPGTAAPGAEATDPTAGTVAEASTELRPDEAAPFTAPGWQASVTVTVTVLLATIPASAAPTVTVCTTVTVCAWSCLLSSSWPLIRSLPSSPSRRCAAACHHVSCQSAGLRPNHPTWTSDSELRSSTTRLVVGLILNHVQKRSSSSSSYRQGMAQQSSRQR